MGSLPWSCRCPGGGFKAFALAFDLAPVTESFLAAKEKSCGSSGSTTLNHQISWLPQSCDDLMRRRNHTGIVFHGLHEVNCGRLVPLITYTHSGSPLQRPVRPRLWALPASVLLHLTHLLLSFPACSESSVLFIALLLFFKTRLLACSFILFCFHLLVFLQRIFGLFSHMGPMGAFLHKQTPSSC